MRLGNLAVNQGIVKTDLGRVGRRIGEINARKPGPVDRPQAHGTWLTRGVNLAAFQVESTKFLARIANRKYFRVSRGIIRRSDLIRALANNVSVFNHDGAERPTAPRADVINRELNGACH